MTLAFWEGAMQEPATPMYIGLPFSGSRAGQHGSCEASSLQHIDQGMSNAR